MRYKKHFSKLLHSGILAYTHIGVTRICATGVHSIHSIVAPNVDLVVVVNIVLTIQNTPAKPPKLNTAPSPRLIKMTFLSLRGCTFTFGVHLQLFP